MNTLARSLYEKYSLKLIYMKDSVIGDLNVITFYGIVLDSTVLADL